MAVSSIPLEIIYLRDSWMGKRDTHESRYFLHIWSELRESGIVSDESVIVDPFARNCPLGTFTNDLNPNTLADDHEDALEWLKALDSDIADFAILDPPFSDVANERIYGYKTNLYTDATYFKGVMMELGRIVKPGGYILRLGYTTSNLNRTLSIKRLYVVNFFSPRNDVLVSLFQVASHTLREWSE